MLRHSFGLERGAAAIEAAVEAVLAAGHRTGDLGAAPGRAVGTREMGTLVAEAASNTVS
jgi:3-isopropylmalate dehydrogenase